MTEGYVPPSASMDLTATPGQITNRLLFMAASLKADDRIVAVFIAAADAWAAGDRGSLVTAVVALADDLWTETWAKVRCQ